MPPAWRKGEAWLANPANPELLKAEADVEVVVSFLFEVAVFVVSVALSVLDSAFFLGWDLVVSCDSVDVYIYIVSNTIQI